MTKFFNAAPYSILLSEEAVKYAEEYLKDLKDDRVIMGRFLSNQLKNKNLSEISAEDLMASLFDTKRPQIFAESAISGNGDDWNMHELRLLGDVSVAIPVTIFDDGKHHSPTPHKTPLSGVLLFTPGALLCNMRGYTPADWTEVTTANGDLSEEGYYALYRRRLFPVFHYINAHARQPRSAFVTVPGLGCGQFAGPFRGKLGMHLQEVLQRFLSEYGDYFQNIKAVYFDPYNECQNVRFNISGISLMVRPLLQNQGKSQLCHPVTYAEEFDDFSGCSLYSVVAWDHVSWPGNDFFIGSRMTDDGVKAAATSSMSVLTGVEGFYNAEIAKYQPYGSDLTWGEIVINENKRLWNSAALWNI